MKRMLALGVSLCAGLAAPASSQSVEISFLGGWTTPTLEQVVVFDPEISVPGGDIRQQGQFKLTATGGLAFGGSLSFYFNDNFGIEGRVDTVDFDLAIEGPRLTTDVDLGAAVPGAEAFVDITGGAVNVERLFPVSINAKGRSSGRARFVASGGLSYLPRVSFVAVQPVTLGLSGLGTSIELARVVLQAGAIADASEARWGVNGGAGFEVDVLPSVALTGDFRVHRFQPQSFVWQRSDNPSSELEATLIDELEKLPPIEIELIYFQVTGGITIRF